jgi:hypothetical protein
MAGFEVTLYGRFWVIPEDIGAFVVILNWNGWKDRIECLGSIFASAILISRLSL